MESRSNQPDMNKIKHEVIDGYHAKSYGGKILDIPLEDYNNLKKYQDLFDEAQTNNYKLMELVKELKKKEKIALDQLAKTEGEVDDLKAEIEMYEERLEYVEGELKITQGKLAKYKAFEANIGKSHKKLRPCDQSLIQSMYNQGASYDSMAKAVEESRTKANEKNAKVAKSTIYNYIQDLVKMGQLEVRGKHVEEARKFREVIKSDHPGEKKEKVRL